MEKESAPKKQFRLKKKTFFIFLVVFILLASVATGVTYFLLKDREERLESEAEYNKLLEYCGEGNGEVLECKVLLGDFYDSEDGKKDCMEIVLPIVDVEAREVVLCFKKGVVDWENPYDDYSMYVPVLIRISDYESISQVGAANIEILDDEESWGMVSEVYKTTGKSLFIWTQEYKGVMERGYDFVGRGGHEERFSPSGITIRRGRVLSYDLEDGVIKLKLEAFVLGEDKIFYLESEKFPVVNFKAGEGLWIDAQNIVELDQSLNYGITFFLEDSSLFSVEFVEEQLSLLMDGEESNLLFDSLEVINEK